LVGPTTQGGMAATEESSEAPEESSGVAFAWAFGLDGSKVRRGPATRSRARGGDRE
jgi:hypothetical protein